MAKKGKVSLSLLQRSVPEQPLPWKPWISNLSPSVSGLVTWKHKEGGDLWLFMAIWWQECFLCGSPGLIFAQGSTLGYQSLSTSFTSYLPLNISFRKERVFFTLCIIISSVYHQVEVIIVVTPFLQLCAIPSLSRTYCICHEQQLNVCFRLWGSCHLSGKSCNIAATRHALLLKGMGSKTLACEWNIENSKGNAAGTLRAFKQLSLGSNNPNEKHLVYLLWVCENIQHSNSSQPSVVYLTLYRSSDSHKRKLCNESK